MCLDVCSINLLWLFFFFFLQCDRATPVSLALVKILVGWDKWRLFGPSKHWKLKWWSWWLVMSAKMLTLPESEQFLVSRAPNFSVCPWLSPCFCLSFNLSYSHIISRCSLSLSHTSKNCCPLIQVSVLTWAKSVRIHIYVHNMKLYTKLHAWCCFIIAWFVTT